MTKIWPNNMLGEKNYSKGMKKGGEMHIFSRIGKKYAYFFLIDLKKNFTKLQKKG